VLVAISYLDQDGDEELTQLYIIDATSGLTSYTHDLDLPENFQGSAIVQVLFGDGAIVGASNIVNYDVEFDGSSSYNMVRAVGVGPEIPDEDLEEVLNGED
jgi:hypothetical protein